jgi:hypothetical protein
VKGTTSSQRKSEEIKKMASSVILNYSSEIVENVREVLWNCKERGGLFGGKFAVAEATRLQGSWGTDVVNVASMIVLGAQMFPGQGKASDAQLNILVEKARKLDPILISEIARLRAAKGK